MSHPPLWQPLPGPQMQAFNSEADELFYGGAAGGGKSDLLLGLAATKHRRSIIFRRNYPAMRALIERTREMYDPHGDPLNSFNEQLHLWRLRGGTLIEFGSIQYEHDRFKYKGRPHDLYCWDEVTEFSETQFRFVNAWNRTATKGQRCRIVATGNPPSAQEGQWVKQYWSAWLDAKHANPAAPGELRWYARIDDRDEAMTNGAPFEHKGKIIHPRSRTFIPARLTDNPYLNEEYIALLQSQPEPYRSQLLYGDFTVGVKDDEWQVIPTAWVYAAIERWKKGKPMLVDEPNKQITPQPLTALGCDIAHGGEDSTVIAKLYGTWFDELKKYPGSVTDTGEKAVKLIIDEWEKDVTNKNGTPNNVPIAIDMIGYGVSAYDVLKGKGLPVRGINFADASNKRDKSKHYGFLNVRAECYWKLREALDPEGDEKIALPDDPELVADLTAARWEPTVRGIKIEPKEEIKKRLGRSPDKGDAVTLCWKAARGNNYKAVMWNG
ncbi:MAG TPA: terminase [Candidatus Kapabacteria bacterium]|nr:terminase [Candidatus Kapabacteria bacterium]